MSQNISQQPLANRFEHLVNVIGSERFLQMRGLNNDLSFYICEFRASEAVEMQRLQRQLIEQQEIDLDDGVKKNYVELGQALKMIPGLEARDEE